MVINTAAPIGSLMTWKFWKKNEKPDPVKVLLQQALETAFVAQVTPRNGIHIVYESDYVRLVMFLQDVAIAWVCYDRAQLNNLITILESARDTLPKEKEFGK